MCDYMNVWDSGERKARKQHRCDFCELPIPSGEKYSYQTGLWEGEPTTYKSHLECDQAAHLIWNGTKDPCALEYGVYFYRRELYGQRDEYDKKAFALIAKVKWRTRHLVRVREGNEK